MKRETAVSVMNRLVGNVLKCGLKQMSHAFINHCGLGRPGYMNASAKLTMMDLANLTLHFLEEDRT